jgi:hypothetical protein
MFTLLAGVISGRAQVTTQPALDADDPWAKYGHDERNSCCSPYRGPHCEPELRWWAELGVNTDADENGTTHHFGPAIAKIGGIRYVFVGTREGDEESETLTGRLLVFRFHPADANYEPFDENGDPVPADPVCTIDLGYPVNSTPLVLPDDQVVVQTQYDVQCWDVSGINSDPADPDVTRVWRFPPQTQYTLRSGSCSPTYARLRYDQETARVFVQGIKSGETAGALFGLRATDGTQFTQAALPAGHAHHASPAVGPIDGDENHGNFVYAGTQSGDCDDNHLFAIWADSSSICWQHPICADQGDRSTIGAMASPGVFDWGSGASADPSKAELFIASDDAYLWGFYNTEDPPDPWSQEVNTDWISCTAGLTPDGYVIFWSEQPRLYLWSYRGAIVDSDVLDWDITGWVHGAPALDGWHRFIVNTPCNDSPDPIEHVDTGRVISLDLLGSPGNWTGFEWRWSYPTNNPFIIDLTDPEADLDDWPAYYAPLALDQDGTVLCVGWTGSDDYKSYIFALRPLVGELNGDGVSNWDDAPALVSALINPASWDEQYGAVYGINLLGVGDGNNDGAFNNFDITPIRARWDAYGDSEGREGQWNYYRLLIDELEAYFEQEEGS